MSWRRLFSRASREHARAEEIKAHLDACAEQLQAQGRTPEDAHREARLKFGNPRSHLEQVSSLDGIAWLDAVWLDLRYAARRIRRAPGFAGGVLAILTVGLGTSIAVFTVVDTMLLRPLPFDDAGRLIGIVAANKWSSDSEEESNYLAPQDAADLRSRQDVFEALAAVTQQAAYVRTTVDDPGEPLTGMRATADLFAVLRVHPQLGALYTADNEVPGHGDVVLISDRFWRRRFGADSAIIGTVLAFGSGQRRIVGVMPPGFEFPVGLSGGVDFWAPLVSAPPIPRNPRAPDPSTFVVGRLKRGISFDQAQSRVAQIERDLTHDNPEWFAATRFKLTSLRYWTLGGQTRSWLLLLLGAVGSVIALTIVNVASLLLANMSARAHELAVRTALGAARWQVIRGVGVEACLLCLLGMAGATASAYGILAVLRAAMPDMLPFAARIAVDTRVVIIVAAAAVASGLILGLLPVLRASRAPGSGLGDGGHGATSIVAGRIRTGLVVLEVTLAVVLAIGCGLFTSSFRRALGVDLGADYHNVLTVTFTPRAAAATRTPDVQERNAVLTLAVRDHLAHVAGVQSVALMRYGLRGPEGVLNALRVEGHDGSVSEPVVAQVVTPEYRDVIGLRVRKGRWLTIDDVQAGQPVVVISELASRLYLHGQDPLTSRVALGDGVARRIVGVVADELSLGAEAGAHPAFYAPLTTAELTRPGRPVILVRTVTDAGSMEATIRREIASIAPMTSIRAEQAMAAVAYRTVTTRRFLMVVLTIFGVTGVLIAGAGIYGVLASTVARRTKEIGIRMALGATTWRVIWLVLGRACALLGAGSAIGLMVAWWLASSIDGFLFQVDARDGGVYAAAVTVLIASGLLAAFVPARRAARVDPLVALRID